MTAGTQTEAARVLALAGAGAADSAAEIDRAVGRIDEAEVTEKVEFLRGLREVIALMRQCEAGVERSIAADFRDQGWKDPVELPGCGMVEVKRSPNWTGWQHDRVRSDWLNAYMASTGGEVADPAEIRDAFLKIASVSQYKVTGLRELGLDPEDYAEKNWAPARVILK